MPNLRNFLFENFRETYWKELERKDRILSNLTLPTAIVTVLAGVEVYYFRNLPPMQFDLWHICFWASFVALFITTLLTVYFIIRALTGYEYGEIAFTEEINKYISNLRTYYEKNSIVEIDDKIEADVRNYLTAEYIKNNDRNAKNNSKKTHYLHNAVKMVIWSFAFFIVGAFPFHLMNTSNIKAQRVETVTNNKGGDLKMADEKPTQKPEPPPKPPEKPQPPPSRLTKDEKLPPKDKRLIK